MSRQPEGGTSAYDFNDLYQFARQAGFNDSQSQIMAAIGLAESSGNARAYNGKGRDNSYGIWQINMIGAMGPERRRQLGLRSNDQLFDPATNARAAYAIFRQQGLGAWSTYSNGAYKRNLDTGRMVVTGAGKRGTQASARAGGGGGLVMPVIGGKYSNDWGAGRSGGRSHEGTDIFAPRGTAVVAMAGGKVVKGFSNAYGGNVVRVQGDDGRYYYYAHLDTIAGLKVGQRVTAGQKLGTVGTSGNAEGTSPHLHLGIYQGDKAINPYPILQGSAEGAATGVDPKMLAQDYGYAAAFYGSDPSIAALLDEAVREQWTPQQFAARLKDTDWYRKNSAARREWEILRTSDPAEAKAQKQDRRADVLALSRQLGVHLTADRLTSLTWHSLAYGWDDEALRRAVAAEFDFNPKAAYTGLAGKTMATLKEQARSYLVPLANPTLEKWTQRVLAGDADETSYVSYLQKQAKSLFPELAADIDRGVTVEEYLDPYRQSAAQLLERPPEEIDFMHPAWSRAAFRVDPKTNTRHVMSLADWQTELRTDNRYGWDKTQNARQGAAQFADTLLKEFGRVGG